MERIMKLFKEKYKELELKDKQYGGDKLILDSYKLSDGIYKNINTNEVLVVNKNTDKTTDLYKWFSERDMYCRFINQDMNYGIENKKKILSTNCYSLFFKTKTKLQDCKNNLTPYYNNLKKFSDNKDIDNISDYIVENISVIYEELMQIAKEQFSTIKEQYIKIFFDVDFEKYKIEEFKYLTDKLLSGNKIVIDSKEYGIGNLTNLNVEKKFLIPTTLKNGYSQLMEFQDTIINQHKFLLWLWNQEPKFYIPMDYNFIICPYYDLKNVKEEYIYYVEKNKKDNLCDVIIVENKKEIDFNIINLFENIEEFEEDFKINEWWKLLSKINYVYFKETSKKIKMNKELKDELLKIKDKYNITIGNLFYNNNIKSFIDNQIIYRDVLKSYLLYGESKFDIMKLINLNQSLVNYKNGEGGEDMQDRLYEIREKLDNINWKENYTIEDDIEFAYIGGQVANYFNYIRESKEKHYDFVLNFINNLNVNIFTDNIVRAFQRSSYKISIGSRSNVLLNALLSYKPKNNKIDRNIFIVGSIDNNYILKKNKKDDINNEKEGK